MLSAHSDEFRLIEAIARRERPHPAVEVGIGDDAAVLSGGGLLASDTLLEGRHFTSDADPAAVGHKAIAVNLSDIAAMGGEPLAATVSLTLHRADGSATYADRLMQGLQATAAKYGVSVVGGDTTTWDGPVAVGVTVWGRVPDGQAAVLRSSGSPGDQLFVTGPLGGSLAGRHLTFPPRLAEGQTLARLGASAMIDLSDGLASDVRHLAAASGGGVEIDGDAVPRSEHASSLEAALTGGEDFELLFAMPPAAAASLRDAGFPTWRVGTLTEGDAVWLTAGGRTSSLKQVGFSHALD